LTNVGSGTTYGYDAWGRLTGATVGSTSVSYTYDALSRTLSRAVSGGSTTAYTYSGTGQDPTSQTVGAGSPTYYAWGAAGPLAQKSGTSTRFFATDPHGDLAAVFDTAGVATGV
jgi:YD repeat-containing protein